MGRVVSPQLFLENKFPQGPRDRRQGFLDKIGEENSWNKSQTLQDKNFSPLK